jgi:hypothetical protein
MYSGAAIRNTLGQCSQEYFLAAPSSIRKLTTDPQFLVHVNIRVDCTDEKNQKLKIYISGPLLFRYEYILVTYITIHCMISA